MKSVAVIGLGYVGLPLAVQAAQKGYQVVGIDLNQTLVDQINQRESPFVNDTRFAQVFTSIPMNKFYATTSFVSIRDAEIILICVPTPTEDGSPDLGFVFSTAHAIATHLRLGQLVILESTVNPGVTRNNMLPILAQSGLRCGDQFYLAHCPERVDPGNREFYVGNLNRVVGGITSECTQRAYNFYTSIIEARIVCMNSVEEAEFVKAWENTHRNVLISLANAAAIICDSYGMDILSVISGMQSKVDQLGLELAIPGIGPGGHCIPEDIWYVIAEARRANLDAKLLVAAAEHNDKMPAYAVGQLGKLVRAHKEDLKNLHVTLLGLAYKPDVADKRRSPAIEVAYLLVQRVGSLRFHDPYVRDIEIKGATFQTSLHEAISGTDIIFVATAHTEYLRYLQSSYLQELGVRYVFDGRNCLDAKAIKEAGLIYQGVGHH